MNYAKVHKSGTDQIEKVPGVKKQKKNNAGGVSFKITKWQYFERFLILGTEGGTFYVNEKKYTKDACNNVVKCIDSNGIKVVSMIVDVSINGKSAKNDACIFALALAASCNSSATRKFALSKLNDVCRIGTHLFTFVDYVKQLRGFGRGLRDAIAHWYTTKPIDKLAYQMLKYKQRNGWSHRDVLRLCHAQPINKKMDKLFAYAVGKRKNIPKVSDYAKGARKLLPTADGGLHSIQSACDIITKYRLTREVIPNEWFKYPDIWEAMLPSMPVTALVRSLSKMAELRMHIPFSDSLKLTIDKLTDVEAIKKSRIHPVQVANALITYGKGYGYRGDLVWEPSPIVSVALEDMFYTSFKNVEPSGKRIMLALDVSGSMQSKMNNSMMSCAEATAVLSMVTMRTEPQCFIVGFTAQGKNPYGVSGGFYGEGISELDLTSRDTIASAMAKTIHRNFTATDCSLPFIYCNKRNIDVDAVVIYTDNETWAGNIHPWEALDKLQQKLGHAVKCVVVGMTATKFSIARPDYPNMMDFCGMDTQTPQAISKFIAM
jgi:60 kDa SS-A/Ro ribonucleoprotein